VNKKKKKKTTPPPPQYAANQKKKIPSEKTNILEKIRIDSMPDFNETVGEVSPLLIVFNSLDVEGAASVRRHPLTVTVPLVMISDKIDNAADVAALSQYSRLIICHRAAVSSSEFRARIQAVIGGAEILPPHTGVLVKKAILYFGRHAESHISRWKLADSINVSEDYLTRIFHREIGLSLWDYLSRLRIFLAADLLRRTDDTIQDIASRTGFQDHAYFCRVFKKIYGVPPGQLRKH
jgi:AraC-like DNA-binding protein